jgi:hypothetical protein
LTDRRNRIVDACFQLLEIMADITLRAKQSGDWMLAASIMFGGTV